jgi:hypothetical protein
MAKLIDMEWYYNAVYWMGSQSTHATAIAVDDYVRVTEQKKPLFQMGLSTRHNRPELAAVNDMLIRSLMYINEAFELKADKRIEAAQRLYKETFGLDPLLHPHEPQDEE